MSHHVHLPRLINARQLLHPNDPCTHRSIASFNQGLAAEDQDHLSVFKLQECLPLTVLLHNRPKYVLTGKEVLSIVKQWLIKIDDKVRTDLTYLTGFSDVISIEKSSEHFHLFYDVLKVAIDTGGVPHIVTNNSYTICYPDPVLQVNDTVKYDLDQAKVVDILEFDMGNIVIVHCEKHIGGFNIVHVKDCSTILSLPGVSSFLSVLFLPLLACRVTNIFVIGEGNNLWIPLLKGKGTKLSISEERNLKRKHAAEQWMGLAPVVVTTMQCTQPRLGGTLL
ncbi:40S ribosomal protein S4 [Mycena venus]|uniref:40S ribosomal protein S4 n=1 Tax=Mycena venus TaxID=2733690 RepID=A0A8H6YL78_9AGAR|nr:40S ribosomal protein S4 [Mycena venus]